MMNVEGHLSLANLRNMNIQHELVHRPINTVDKVA